MQFLRLFLQLALINTNGFLVSFSLSHLSPSLAFSCAGLLYFKPTCSMAFILFHVCKCICVLMGSKVIVFPIKERKKKPQIHDKSLKHPKLCPISSHYNHIYSVLHISMNSNPTLPNTHLGIKLDLFSLKLKFNTHKSCLHGFQSESRAPPAAPSLQVTITLQA